MPEPVDDSSRDPPPAGVAAALLCHGTDLVAVTDAAGRIQWANAAFDRATGRHAPSRGELATLLADGDAAADDGALMARALREGSTAPLPLHWRDADGRSLWVRARVMLDPPRTIWIAQDVTHSVETARTARRRAELLATIRKFGRLGVWERDSLTGAGHWDEQGFRIWGINPAQGTPPIAQVRAMVHPDDRHLLQNSTQRGAPGIYSAHYRILRPDGQQRRIHSQWEVKADAAGRPERIVGIVMDDTEVYETARSLSDASAQLQLAVELGGIATWRRDIATDTVHFPPSALVALGRSSAAAVLTGSEVEERIHPDDRAANAAALERTLLSFQPVDLQTRYRTDDGQWRTFMTRRVAQRDREGKPISVLVVALDISTLVEERLHAQEQARQFDAAAAAAGLGIWSRDLATGKGEWNRQMYVLAGRDPGLPPPDADEWLEDIVHPDDRHIVAEARRRMAAGEATRVEFESRVRMPDVQVRWLAVRASREHWSGKPMILGVTYDVTEAREAGLALKHADERAALAARSVGIGTWETSLKTGQRQWDEQMFRLRGLPAGSDVPTPSACDAMMHPDDAPAARAALDRAIQDLQPSSYEFRVRLPDGTYRWLASRSFTVYDDAGRPDRQVGVNWDVTDAKSAGTAQARRISAERASQAKSQFLSRMSHELRTPLNAVLGFTQLLELDAGHSSAEMQLSRLAHIRRAGEHLLTLINDMLELSSLDAGEQRFDLHPVDLDAVLGGVVADVAPLADQRQVRLRCEPAPAAMLADAQRLRQALARLLGDAIEACPEQGEVRIEMHAHADRVVLRISDTGHGLAARQVNGLFASLEDAGRHDGSAAADTSAGEHTDVGLLVAKALVEGMGGTLNVVGAPDRGSHIELTLPRAAAPTAAANASPDPGPPDCAAQRQGRLLYIEDNAVNVLLIEELVRGLPGLSMASELTGGEGVERARRERPDLILIDMQLPDIDGTEVLRRLRADPATAGITCIALSANAMPQDIERARQLGFSDYWTKPIDLKDIVGKLERLFPAKAGAAV